MTRHYYHVVRVDTLESVGPTSESPGLLYDWAEREGWAPGTVAVMPLRGGLKRCEQKRSTVHREARRYRAEVAEYAAMDAELDGGVT